MAWTRLCWQVWQSFRDCLKGSFELVTQGREYADDAHRNQPRNQPVLNGGSTFFVIPEALDEIGHLDSIQKSGPWIESGGRAMG